MFLFGISVEYDLYKVREIYKLYEASKKYLKTSNIRDIIIEISDIINISGLFIITMK